MKSSTVRPHILYIGERRGFFSREILRGVLSMRPEGCDWDFWCMPISIEEKDLKQCLKNRRVDGIIARGLSEEMSRFVVSLGVPAVIIRAAEDESADYVNGPHVDDTAIGRLAGVEFNYLNLGYWGFVHWDGVMWSEARKKSFHSYATSLGVSNSTLALPNNARLNWESVSIIAEWIKSLPKPCGILACNDEAGLDVLHACQLIGVKVPQEVAVIGVDNDRLLCESTTPSLTSIDLRAADVGRESALQLAQLLKGNADSHGSPMNVATTVVRSSSHDVDRYMLTYQKALDFIHARALKNMSVADVARACGISRRGLERAFEKCANSSPAAVMREKRIEAILGLLKDRTASLESISQQAGFSDAAGLSNFVKRMTGKTPGAFRDGL